MTDHVPVAATSPREVVLVIAHGPTSEALRADVAEVVGDRADVVLRRDARHAAAWLREMVPADLANKSPRELPIQVGLVVHLAGPDEGDELLRTLTALPGAVAAQYLLVTDRAEHKDLSWIIDQDRLIGVLMMPWTVARLVRLLQYHLRRQEEDADWYLSRSVEPPAPGSSEARAPEPKPPVTQEKVESPLLGLMEMRLTDAVNELIEALEEVIGPRPRILVPEGVRITHEDDEMHAIMLVLRGRVSMTMPSRVGDMVLHHASSGPVVGLLSLADQKRAFFTARTTTPCVLVHITTQQLDRALEKSPRVAAAMTAVAIRVLSGRVRRAQGLHIEKLELARQLDEERKNLAETLEALENARTQLIAQARFATLGELSAGIAHELNNPSAAMARAVEHLHAEVDRLIETHPRRAVLTNAIEKALTAKRGSAAEQRMWRREVEQVVKDRDLARRLVAAGIRDKASAKAVRKHIELVEIGAGIGTSLRNLEQGGEHVMSLVESLRAQTRPETTKRMDVDVVASLERAIRITGHRLHNVKVTWKVEDDIPIIQAHPASLAQVWTNQLVNAADAMADNDKPPQIRLGVKTIGSPGDDWAVQVTITDNGRGIAPENIERIFHPQFTTKHGTVRYGLGMGLGISRRIVEELGGTLLARSKPGKTTFTTILPVEPVTPDQSASAEPSTNPEEN